MTFLQSFGEKTTENFKCWISLIVLFLIVPLCGTHYWIIPFFLKNKLFLAGFINLGTSQNRQIANFQYVAPLMAYFDPSLDDSSSVHHLDNGKH